MPETKPKAKKYIAMAGMNFDGLKGKPRVEIGDLVPDGLTDKEIKQLLADGDVKEAE